MVFFLLFSLDWLDFSAGNLSLRHFTSSVVWVHLDSVCHLPPFAVLTTSWSRWSLLYADHKSLLLPFLDDGNCPSVRQAVGVEVYASQRELWVWGLCLTGFFHVCLEGDPFCLDSSVPNARVWLLACVCIPPPGFNHIFQNFILSSWDLMSSHEDITFLPFYTMIIFFLNLWPVGLI